MFPRASGITLLPIRHHSPACARLVRLAILESKPRAVLIEGPSDFNDRLGELWLAHEPPIAIYSHLRWDSGGRQGAYYPFCEFSPEWQALLAAREIGAEAWFIDLPFAATARLDATSHRYADGRLSAGDYVARLTQALGVETFHDAWDVLAEQDSGPATAREAHAAIARRVADYCRALREMDKAADRVSESDQLREAFMAAHLRHAAARLGAENVLVVTGGYHTAGLEKLLVKSPPQACHGLEGPPVATFPADLAERGIAITPYSHERLDGLKGYDAGMPSPGFYHESWRQGGGAFHLRLLKTIAQRLREKKQLVSTADLVAVSVTAEALATLRGRPRVWRRDLVDAVISALVKDDLRDTHPFLVELLTVLRGDLRGSLAPESPLPPLVREIQRLLRESGLEPAPQPKTKTLSLTKPAELKTSRFLHQLAVLGIPGIVRTQGVDFHGRADLTQLEELWTVRWAPEQDAGMIEASRYGAAPDEAAAARLQEAASVLERNAAAAAALLVDATQAGVLELAEFLRQTVAERINEDGSLASVAMAMSHLLHLYAWDDVLGSRGHGDTGRLLAEACARGVWLLEGGAPPESDAESIQAVRLIRDAFERAEPILSMDRQVLTEALGRAQADPSRSPATRGACSGALWSLHAADPADIQREMLQFADPTHLGDFLTGLFTLAREAASRHQALPQAIHAVIQSWDDTEFLTALPALRLAFMQFTTREKFHLASNLFDSPAQDEALEPAPLAVSLAEAADNMALEAALAALAQTYGIRLD